MENNDSDTEPQSSKKEENQSRHNEVREGDWQCPSCEANVFGRNLTCFRCQTPKPGSNARVGDWNCLNKMCGAHNYASRHQCYRCHVAKGLEKPGDWLCPNCHSNNFAGRNECFRCRLPRPPGYPVLTNIRPGDWLCPNPSCGCNVFANRDSCFRCNTPRPSDAEVASTYSEMRQGDWTCRNCNVLCFAHRQVCYKCQAPKPPVLTEETPNPHHLSAYSPNFQYPAYSHLSFQAPHYAQPFFSYYPQSTGHTVSPQPRGLGNHVYKKRDGDWTCGGCGYENYARRTSCFKCTESKPPINNANHVSPRENGSSEDILSKNDATWSCSCGIEVSTSTDLCPTCQSSRA